MATKLITLGTKGGPRLARNGSWHTSSLLDIDDSTYVIDCGLGVTKQMIQAGYHLNQLNKIIITHYHSDHTLELGALLHTAWCDGLDHPIDIYGPPGLIEMVNGYYQFQKIDMQIRIEDEGLKPLSDFIRLHEFSFAKDDVGIVFQDENLILKAMKNIHPPFIETYALRFEIEHNNIKKTVVLSGDTAYYEPMIDFAQDADLLLHEVMIQEGIDQICEQYKFTKPDLRKHLLASHTFAKDVGKLANQASVKHLAFYHYVPADLNGIKGIDQRILMQELQTYWHGKTSITQDGDEIHF